MEKDIKPRYKILGKIYFIAYLIILVYLLFFAEVFGTKILDATEQNLIINAPSLITGCLSSFLRAGEI